MNIWSIDDKVVVVSKTNHSIGFVMRIVKAFYDALFIHGNGRIIDNKDIDNEFNKTSSEFNSLFIKTMETGYDGSDQSKFIMNYKIEYYDNTGKVFSSTKDRLTIILYSTDTYANSVFVIEPCPSIFTSLQEKVFGRFIPSFEHLLNMATDINGLKTK